MADVYTLAYKRILRRNQRREIAAYFSQIYRWLQSMIDEEAKSLRLFYDYYGPDSRNCIGTSGF
jgi:hypothetical protein